MGLMELLLLLLVAAIAGALGQSLAGFSRGGCLIAIVIGFIGAFLGRWLASGLDLPPIIAVDIGGSSFPLVWAIIGAAIFSLILGMITRKRPPAA